MASWLSNLVNTYGYTPNTSNNYGRKIGEDSSNNYGSYTGGISIGGTVGGGGSYDGGYSGGSAHVGNSGSGVSRGSSYNDGGRTIGGSGGGSVFDNTGGQPYAGIAVGGYGGAWGGDGSYSYDNDYDNDNYSFSFQNGLSKNSGQEYNTGNYDSNYGSNYGSSYDSGYSSDNSSTVSSGKNQNNPQYSFSFRNGLSVDQGQEAAAQNATTQNNQNQINNLIQEALLRQSAAEDSSVMKQKTPVAIPTGIMNNPGIQYEIQKAIEQAKSETGNSTAVQQNNTDQSIMDWIWRTPTQQTSPLAQAIEQVNNGNYRMMDNPANSTKYGEEYSQFMDFANSLGITGQEASDYAWDQVLRSNNLNQYAKTNWKDNFQLNPPIISNNEINGNNQNQNQNYSGYQNRSTGNLQTMVDIKNGKTSYEEIYKDYVGSHYGGLYNRYKKLGYDDQQAMSKANENAQRMAYERIYELGYRPDPTKPWEENPYLIKDINGNLSLGNYVLGLEKAIGNDFYTNAASNDTRLGNMLASGTDLRDDRLFYDLTSELAGNAYANKTKGTNYSTTPGITNLNDPNNPSSWNTALQAAMSGQLSKDQIMHFYDSVDSDLVIPEETKKWLASDSSHSLQQMFLNMGKNGGRLEIAEGTPEEYRKAYEALLDANPGLKLMRDNGILTDDDIQMNFFKGTKLKEEDKGKNSYSYGGGGSYGGGYSGGGGGGGGSSSRSNSYSGSSSATKQSQSRIHNIMKNWTF